MMLRIFSEKLKTPTNFSGDISSQKALHCRSRTRWWLLVLKNAAGLPEMAESAREGAEHNVTANVVCPGLQVHAARR